jgi:RNA polymerase sigma-70 factor (ECF subfamily)
MDIRDGPETRAAISILVDGLGDPDARVAAIYGAHYQHLVGLASMLAGGSAIGEEIAQETFVIALQNERRTPGYLTDPVWPWLRITALHLASRFRAQLRRELLPRLIQSNDLGGSQAWGVETIDVVRALRQLPSKMRLCVVLAHLEDQGTASIAAMLGCSPKTVENQLREGRHRLRTILGEDYNT